MSRVVGIAILAVAWATIGCSRSEPAKVAPPSSSKPAGPATPAPKADAPPLRVPDEPPVKPKTEEPATSAVKSAGQASTDDPFGRPAAAPKTEPPKDEMPAKAPNATKSPIEAMGRALFKGFTGDTEKKPGGRP